ncbi:hypothetical protein Tco_1480788 [Tanacetum coccineum]
MDEPLSPDRVFNFPVDELEPHPAYDFFAPEPLPGYAGNPNNNNGWLKADDYLLGELEAIADEPMVGPMVDEIAEQMIVPAVEEIAEPMVTAEEQMVAPVIDMEEDLIALIERMTILRMMTLRDLTRRRSGSVYKVGGPSTAVAEGPFFPLRAPGLPIPSVVSDVEVAAGVTIGEIGLRVFAIEGHIQQRDTQIQQLQTTVTEMGIQESTLMRCILGLEKRSAALEKRPPGPQ